MKKYLMILLIFLCITLISFLLFKTKKERKVVALSESNVVSCDSSDEVIIQKINERRVKAGVPPVYSDSLLNTIADNRATSLNGTMDNHEGFRTIRTIPGYFGKFGYAGENLAIADCDPVVQWDWSKPHYAAMVDSRYDSIGIGHNQKLFVAIFGDSK